MLPERVAVPSTRWHVATLPPACALLPGAPVQPLLPLPWRPLPESAVPAGGVQGAIPRHTHISGHLKGARRRGREATEHPATAGAVKTQC